MGIPDQKWNLRKQNLADTIDNLGDQFRPIPRIAWKENIKKMNPADIPRPAPAAFEDSLLVAEPDDPEAVD